MSLELQEAKKDFYSKYHRCYESSDSSDYIEDCQFSIFTNLLEESEIVKSLPIVSRESGEFKRSKWSILGYCESNDKLYLDDEDQEDEEEIQEKFQNNWHYVIFNGFFTEDTNLEVLNARKDEIDKSLKESITFLEKTFNKELINDITKAGELQSSLIKSIEDDNLSKIEIIIITDKVILQDKLQTSCIIQGRNININYWDLKRWSDLKRSKSKREAINIDLRSHEFDSYKIDFVKKKLDKFLTQYLAIFPANLIADLYDKYDTRLLEKNVRVFLSAGRKANQAMRTTIKEDPQYFFSFNNGISATVEKMIIEDEEITNISDFQIVNGGQTTATIHYARKKDIYKDGSRVSLENVFVPVKITEINKTKYINPSEIVSNISRAANTQSAIKNSDFHSNNHFLVEIERLSKRLPVTNNTGKNTYYFFERMTGQYNADMNSKGTSRNINIFKKEKPNAFKFGKIDIGRWYNCMNGFPHIAALSAEKQFDLFMNDKYFKKPVMIENNFKTLIGFGMLFNRIRKLVGKKNAVQYPPLISDPSVGMATAIYSTSILHKISDGRIDYWHIYNHGYSICDSLIRSDRVFTDLDNILESVIKQSWKQLKAFGQTSVQEQTKKPECWLYFQKNFKIENEIEKSLKDYLISIDEKTDRESVEIKDDKYEYFSNLDFLIVKNPAKLESLLSIASRDSNYREYKSLIKNIINRIKSGDNIIKMNRLKDIIEFDLKLKSLGNDINNKKQEYDFNISINFIEIYDIVFKDFNHFCEKIENFIYDEVEEFENNFDLNYKNFETIKEIYEILDITEGLSMNELLKLESLINYFKEKKFIN